MVGLLQDDILNDEIDIVKEAISRLSDHEAFERTFRIRRAMQLELSNSSLPEAEWTRYDQDKRYLWPHVREICAERDEAVSISRLLKRPAAFY